MELRREARAGGHRVSYLVDGEGPLIVMIPARLQSAEFWNSLGYAASVLDSHRVITVDKLGHGQSDGPTDPAAYEPEALVRQLVAVIEQETEEPCCLWGYGYGAEIALSTARRRPELVSGLVLGGLYLGDYASGMSASGGDLAGMTERCARALDDGNWSAYFDALPVAIPEDLRVVFAADNDAAAHAALTRADALRARGFLKPTVPTFVYWADGEPFAVHNARRAERLPVEYAVIAGSYADGFLRADQVSVAVKRFLSTIVRD
ncbi:MAG: alpha/beta fold hydrolase [Acidimicrobiales bacterium]